MDDATTVFFSHREYAKLLQHYIYIGNVMKPCAYYKLRRWRHRKRFHTDTETKNQIGVQVKFARVSRMPSATRKHHLHPISPATMWGYKTTSAGKGCSGMLPGWCSGTSRGDLKTAVGQKTVYRCRYAPLDDFRRIRRITTSYRQCAWAKPRLYRVLANNPTLHRLILSCWGCVSPSKMA